MRSSTCLTFFMLVGALQCLLVMPVFIVAPYITQSKDHGPCFAEVLIQLHFIRRPPTEIVETFRYDKAQLQQKMFYVDFLKVPVKINEWQKSNSHQFSRSALDKTVLANRKQTCKARNLILTILICWRSTKRSGDLFVSLGRFVQNEYRSKNA